MLEVKFCLSEMGGVNMIPRLDKKFGLMLIMLIVSICILQIGYLQAANVDELVQQMNQNNTVTRLHAIKALGEAKDARAVDPLIAVLKDEKCGITAANALAKIGQPSVAPLFTALKDDNPVARRNAAMALGKIKDSTAVKPLIAALNDENPIVRRNAAKALGEIQDNRAVEPLTAALNDNSPVVRRNAALALKGMGSSETVVVDILHE
jgi:HEAT repeat protein